MLFEAWAYFEGHIMHTAAFPLSQCAILGWFLPFFLESNLEIHQEERLLKFQIVCHSFVGLHPIDHVLHSVYTVSRSG